MSDSISPDEIDSEWKPTKTRARICLDSDLVLEIARLEEELARAQQDESAAAPVGPIAEEIVQLQQRAAASEREFVFHSIGRYELRELKRLHPPTPEQEKILQGTGIELPWNPDTFMPVVFARSLDAIDGKAPTGFDEPWWTRKCREWSDGQIARLWAACEAAQDGVHGVPKALAARRILKSAENSE